MGETNWKEFIEDGADNGFIMVFKIRFSSAKENLDSGHDFIPVLACIETEDGEGVEVGTINYPLAMLERIGMMADDPEASKIVGFDQIYDDFLDDD